MPKSRSKAMVLPSLEIDGQRTRPSLNEVTCFGAPGTVAPGTVAPGTVAPGTVAPGSVAPLRLQIFCAPERSDMKYSVLPSPLHIGHASFAPPFVSCSYLVSRTSQISLSSRWLCPLRHHCEPALARAVIATTSPEGDGAAKYSGVYRSAATGIGIPPSAGTRYT